MLIIGPDLFFQYCQSARIQPKSQFLFYKNLPSRDFYILTLFVTWLLCVMTLCTPALNQFLLGYVWSRDYNYWFCLAKKGCLYDPGNHFIDSESTVIHTWTTILVIELPTQEGTSKGVVLKLSRFLKQEKTPRTKGSNYRNISIDKRHKHSHQIQWSCHVIWAVLMPTFMAAQ